MKTFSIHDIPEFSQKERIVVVGVIGKSPYRCPNKATPLISTVNTDENGIECHWDERRGVLYLHAVTYLDTKQLTKLAATLDENSKTTDKDADAAHWLVASGELAADSCRIMALLFNLCHIVVLSHPTSVFDVGYLQLFKAIDAFRAEIFQECASALSGFGGVWESHGRACCPRLLFHFRRAPPPLRRAPASLKRLEHATEDHLYFTFRIARIITNVCAKALFAIPKNEEFVYINAEDTSGARDVSSLISGLVQRCQGTAPPADEESVRPSFSKFLRAHIDLAFKEGFDDNVGKYAMSTSFFELPSASVWRSVAEALRPVYLQEGGVESSDSESPGALFDTLATDVRFSQARCAKVLPIAQASYAEGLPSHYSSQHHAHKMNVALGVLESMARGPLAGGARTRLRAVCRAAHRARRLCEAQSLTGHPCLLPAHDSSKEHSSGIRYVSACNCGRTKWTREDPYTVEGANHTFYELAARECGVCPTLQAIEFPVFQPSTPTYKAAEVEDDLNQETEEKAAQGSQENDGEGNEEVEEVEAEGEGDGDGEAWSVAEALSPGSAEEEENSPTSEGYVVPVREVLGSEKVMSRQPSTTEYLPGMLHLESPAGLLPAFPSWSLVCLGPSSLYSHSMGLPEHLQPGFLPHTSFLLPWDCAVRRMEQTNLFRSSRGRGKPPPAHHLTVKIFIGFEYECPRGHRFMMSSADSVVSGGGGGGGGAGREAGARLAAADMPLHAACPARPPHAARAALARLHVVTPKAAVHVTLAPQVQPVAGGPIFVPQPGGAPARLSSSAYWVLRFPRAFCDERGRLLKPSSTGLHTGLLLAPIFGLQE